MYLTIWRGVKGLTCRPYDKHSKAQKIHFTIPTCINICDLPNKRYHVTNQLREREMTESTNIVMIFFFFENLLVLV